MAKIKFGEGGLALELKSPVGVESTENKELAGGLNIIEKKVPETSEIVQEVLNHLPRPEVQNAAIDFLESRLEALSRNVATISAKQMSVQDVLDDIRDKAPIEQVVTPEVKSITHHKDHTKELGEHELRIVNINRVLTNFMKNHEKKLNKQKLINLALGAGIVLSILSHLL